MDVAHPLQSMLHFYLASDAAAVHHVQQVLEQLSSGCLAPSPHLQKWCTRITSLMHSKDPGPRWAGICLAYRTSALSESLLIEHAQTWVGIVLPLLSKPEPRPILKASMRYLQLVLKTATNHPEFQRQIAAPAVPKISAATIAIAENSVDMDTMILATQTLNQLVTLYPSQQKASSPKLFALCYRILGGSAPQSTDSRLLDATAELFSTLHYLGGKVGGASTWRTCVDTVLQSSWVALAALRSTFPSRATYMIGQNVLNVGSTTPSYFGPLPGEPPMAVALSLDRLKCNISAICALLRVPVQRPVKVPLGPLLAFGYALLSCTEDEQHEPLLDQRVRALEVAALPQIWMQGCRLLSHLCQTVQNLAAPGVSRLVMLIACQLEKNQEAPQRLVFLRIACDILCHCPVVGSQLAVTRLTKAVIAPLSSLYLPRHSQESKPPLQSNSKAGKKRRRDFQDDNALSTRQPVVCATEAECNVILTSLDVIRGVLRNVELSPPVRSLSLRVLLTVLLSLPSTPRQNLSLDLAFYDRLVEKVQVICLENAAGTNAMSKSMGLVVRSCAAQGGQDEPTSRSWLQSYMDVLIHPRRPPLTRTLPFIESLSLAAAEETSDEATIRKALGLSRRTEVTKETRAEALEPSKVLQPAQAPLEVHESESQPPSLQPPKQQASAVPPIDTPPEPSIIDNQDLPMAESSPSPTAPSLRVLQPQLTPKLVNPAPTSLMADEDDNEEMPVISLDSDSDSDY